jgi:hypothetical protein
MRLFFTMHRYSEIPANFIGHDEATASSRTGESYRIETQYFRTDTRFPTVPVMTESR